MSARTSMRHIRSGLKSSSDEERSIPWREAFAKDIEKYGEAGLVLAGSRHKEGMTQKELAKKLRICPHHISEMEHGKRPIGKAMAKRLAKVFKINYRAFL